MRTKMRTAMSFCQRSRLSAGTSDHCLARTVSSLFLQAGLNADQADIATVEMRLPRVHSVGMRVPPHHPQLRPRMGARLQPARQGRDGRRRLRGTHRKVQLKISTPQNTGDHNDGDKIHGKGKGAAPGAVRGAQPEGLGARRRADRPHLRRPLLHQEARERL